MHNWKIFIDVVALVLLYFLFFRKKWYTQRRDIRLMKILMYIYLSFVLFFTMMPIICNLPFVFDHPYNINLVPFDDYMNGRGDVIKQIVLNVIMTIPFGFLFPLTQKEEKRTFSRTLLFTLLLTLSIELLQPILNSWRSNDVTDIITNTTGGLIGYGIYLLFRPISVPILNNIREKKN